MKVFIEFDADGDFSDVQAFLRTLNHEHQQVNQTVFSNFKTVALGIEGSDSGRYASGWPMPRQGCIK